MEEKYKILRRPLPLDKLFEKYALQPKLHVVPRVHQTDSTLSFGIILWIELQRSWHIITQGIFDYSIFFKY